MLTQIQDKVIERINKNIKTENKNIHIEALDAMMLEVARMVSPVNIFVAIDSGNFSNMTLATSFKISIDIDIYVVFRETNREQGRRKGIYPILEGLTQLLMFDYLDMKESIYHLVPAGMKNITSREFAENNLMIFQLTFKTAFNFKRTEEDAPDLLLAGLNYYLGGVHDDPPETSDIIKLGDQKKGGE
jgi:hypothetical protein